MQWFWRGTKIDEGFGFKNLKKLRAKSLHLSSSFGTPANSINTLALCVVGVIFSYVAYHLLFERMISRGEKASEIGSCRLPMRTGLCLLTQRMIGLILMSNIVNVAFSYGALRSKGRRPEKVPLYQAGRISLW